MTANLPSLPPPPIGALTSGEVALLRAWADDHARAAVAQEQADHARVLALQQASYEREIKLEVSAAMAQAGADVPEISFGNIEQAGRNPLFYFRPRSDGGYEGPIHAGSIEAVRVKSGAWLPLYAAPTAQPAPPVAAGLSFQGWYEGYWPQDGSNKRRMRDAYMAGAANAAPLPAREPLSRYVARDLFETWYLDDQSGVELIRRVERAHGITATPADKEQA